MYFAVVTIFPEMLAAVSEFGVGAGIELTASHNPIDYNGMKIVGRGSQPLSEQEFGLIKILAEERNFSQSQKTGVVFDKKEASFYMYKHSLASPDCVLTKTKKSKKSSFK